MQSAPARARSAAAGKKQRTLAVVLIVDALKVVLAHLPDRFDHLRLPSRDSLARWGKDVGEQGALVRLELLEHARAGVGFVL